MQELTAQEQEQVQKLEARDREVRTHEQAHVAAGGPHVLGGPSYQYQTGPDGKQYAIGGEVQIDTSPVAGDPQATIAKARMIQAAALAPASPSAQDRAIAAKAAQMQQQAQADLQELRKAQASQPVAASGGSDTESSAEVASESTDGVQSQTAIADAVPSKSDGITASFADAAVPVARASSLDTQSLRQEPAQSFAPPRAPRSIYQSAIALTGADTGSRLNQLA